jgi:hypothetical protein
MDMSSMALARFGGKPMEKATDPEDGVQSVWDVL